MPSLSEMLKIKIKEEPKVIPKKKKPIKTFNLEKTALKLHKNKILCAVRNPSERSKQPWFYNIFLGNITNKLKRKRIKVNWLMELSEKEVKLLREKTCEIIEITKKVD